jgi:hypothetical protein
MRQVHDSDDAVEVVREMNEAFRVSALRVPETQFKPSRPAGEVSVRASPASRTNRVASHPYCCAEVAARECLNCRLAGRTLVFSLPSATGGTTDRPTGCFGSVASRWDQFRCELLGRLEEDAKGEIDRAAVREQPDRLVQVDVRPQCNLSGREWVVPRPHQLHDAPPLHALDLRLDDLVYRRHPDFLYEIFVCPTNGDMGLVGSNRIVTYGTLYGFFTRGGARVVGLTIGVGRRRLGGQKRHALPIPSALSC